MQVNSSISLGATNVVEDHQKRSWKKAFTRSVALSAGGAVLGYCVGKYTSPGKGLLLFGITQLAAITHYYVTHRFQESCRDQNFQEKGYSVVNFHELGFQPAETGKDALFYLLVWLMKSDNFQLTEESIEEAKILFGLDKQQSLTGNNYFKVVDEYAHKAGLGYKVVCLPDPANPFEHDYRLPYKDMKDNHVYVHSFIAQNSVPVLMGYKKEPDGRVIVFVPQAGVIQIASDNDAYEKAMSEILNTSYKGCKLHVVEELSPDQ